MSRRNALLLAVAALVAPAVAAGAGYEGFGESARGGQGGVRVTVTSLADSGPGTLRDAVDGPGPRRIVFAVAGTIEARRRVVVQGKTGVTIDGASAPAPGITLAGAGLALIDS
jgi:hypothetical protein